MKIKSLFVAVLLMVGVFVAPEASGSNLDSKAAWIKPTLSEFEFFPKEIDLTSANRTINFKIAVQHPIGLISKKITVNLINSRNESPIALQVELMLTETRDGISYFSGSTVFPTTSPSGVWQISSESVLGKSPDDLDGWGSDIFKPAPFRNFPNAESALLVRQNGFLDFQDEVISGPFFPSGIYNSDSRIHTAFPKAVAWRVGEKIDISSYLNFKVPKIEIKLDSLTPDICTTKDAILNLIRLGECQYSIETLRNSDYASYKINRKVEVNLSRSLPYFYVPKIANQTIATLPFQVETELVTSESRLVTPQAQTPSICLNNGTLISIYSSGTCQLKYYLEPTESTFASDVVIQSFEVYKKSQTMTFSTPISGSIESGSVKLEANASSGGSISFTTTLTDVCSVSGSTLNFLKPGVCTVTATQPGTSTIAAISTSATVTITGTLPVVKKTITCVKGKKTIKKTAVSPKCPAGYKLKK